MEDEKQLPRGVKIRLDGDDLIKALALLPTADGEVALVVEHESGGQFLKFVTEQALHSVVVAMEFHRQKQGSVAFVIHLEPLDPETGEKMVVEDGPQGLVLALLPAESFDKAKVGLKSLYALSQLGMEAVGGEEN